MGHNQPGHSAESLEIQPTLDVLRRIPHTFRFVPDLYSSQLDLTPSSIAGLYSAPPEEDGAVLKVHREFFPETNEELETTVAAYLETRAQLDEVPTDSAEEVKRSAAINRIAMGGLLQALKPQELFKDFEDKNPTKTGVLLGGLIVPRSVDAAGQQGIVFSSIPLLMEVNSHIHNMRSDERAAFWGGDHQESQSLKAALRFVPERRSNSPAEHRQELLEFTSMVGMAAVINGIKLAETLEETRPAAPTETESPEPALTDARALLTA